MSESTTATIGSIVQSTTIQTQPDLKPWQRIDWGSCAQARLFRDWGMYYTRKLLNKKALECYGRALAICKGNDVPMGPTCVKPHPRQTRNERICYDKMTGACSDDFRTLARRSHTWRAIAQSERSVQDAQLAKMLMHESSSVKERAAATLEECDALYCANRYEDNLRTIYTEARQISGRNVADLLELRRQRTLSVFNDALGETLGPFMHENMGAIQEVVRQRRAAESFVQRPLWKVLKEQNRCDVQSIMDKEVTYISPLERARRRLYNNVFNYQYLGRSAYDVALLRTLRSDQNFVNPLLRESAPILRDLSINNYATVRKFMKMMHARTPLYCRNYRKCRGKSFCEKNRENYLFRVENQTRRDCFRILREVRQLRREGNIDRLTSYVNDIMANYIALKTQRILPWKLEFINEVYNTLALAHVDRCALPKNVDLLDPKNRGILYLLPPEKIKETHFFFGGPNVYNEMAKDEETHKRATQRIDLLEARYRGTRYPVERTFLCFEIGRSYLQELRFDKCMIMARKAIAESRHCNSTIWRFNSTFLVCQVHAALNRLERLRESLVKATILANELKSPELAAYLKICSMVNDHELETRRMRFSDQSVRKPRRKGRTSTALSNRGASSTSIGTTSSLS
ncbi:uncharacterized protein LOC115627905 [Scaptodrosophila lebanonensis]|uniref:Uncharacterized protein LOC115627905 n=1 Tax=Drosophila lebanonensis TaxID=7225 RepID=A0A6J2TVT4_DROLE|nr:uncharacterized protein LOC115627905 [Scaptodrosophila lebanonensis]